mgnify:CR=1 FL=1
MAKRREIPPKETIEVEFKSEFKRTPNGALKPSRLPDGELVDTVVALSNTNGGEIYLGVEDDGEPTGVHKDHRDVTQLAALIANKTVPLWWFPLSRFAPERLLEASVACCRAVLQPFINMIIYG